MTSKMPSKPSSEPRPTPLVRLLHRGKPRYFLEDLQRGQHSLLLLCSRLLSSHPKESSKPILLSLEERIQSNSKLLDDHLTCLSADLEKESDQPTLDSEAQSSEDCQP